MEEFILFEKDALFYAVISDDIVEVSRNSEIKGAVFIPESVEYEGETYRVARIGRHAFYGNRDITSVAVPESVNEIGDGAFACCTSLVSVNVPEGVQIIQYECFFGCERLKDLVIPDSVTSVEDRAFWYCRDLETISIPRHLLGIEYPKIFPKRGSDSGQCRAMESLKHCFVRLPSGEIEEFDVE